MRFLISLLLGVTLPCIACKTSATHEEENLLQAAPGTPVDAYPPLPPRPMKVVNVLYDALLAQVRAAAATPRGTLDRPQLETALIGFITKEQGIARAQLKTVLTDLTSTDARNCRGRSCAAVCGFTATEVDGLLDDLYEKVRVDPALKADSKKAVRFALLSSLQNHRAHMVVLYWDNKNLGFGHVAVRVFGPNNYGKDPDYYLSFAMGNDYETDMDKHGKEPLQITLPGRSTETYYQFVKWYKKSPYNENRCDYGAAYDPIRENCAHAVLHALHHFAYDIPLSDTRPALLPNQVRKGAEELVQREGSGG